MLKGIDISNWQKGLDIASTGAEFVICKATQGTTFVDPSCDRHYQLAKRLGLKLGVYHYASGGDPIAEADFFLRNIQGYIGEAILILDWERLQNPRFGEHASWCKRFLDRVKDKTGVKPLIYMSASVLRMADWSPVSNADYGLWIAGYPDNRDSWDIPNFPFSIYPWKFYALWQYTSSGGRLDRDIFSELRHLLRLLRRNRMMILLRKLFVAFGETAKSARIVSRRPVTITMLFSRS